MGNILHRKNSMGHSSYDADLLRNLKAMCVKGKKGKPIPLKDGITLILVKLVVYKAQLILYTF